MITAMPAIREKMCFVVKVISLTSDVNGRDEAGIARHALYPLGTVVHGGKVHVLASPRGEAAALRAAVATVKLPIEHWVVNGDRHRCHRALFGSDDQHLEFVLKVGHHRFELGSPVRCCHYFIPSRQILIKMTVVMSVIAVINHGAK
jgi:hypothetical protein